MLFNLFLIVNEDGSLASFASLPSLMLTINPTLTDREKYPKTHSIDI